MPCDSGTPCVPEWKYTIRINSKVVSFIIVIIIFYIGEYISQSVPLRSFILRDSMLCFLRLFSEGRINVL